MSHRELAGARGYARIDQVPLNSRAPVNISELPWVALTVFLILFLQFTPQCFILWPYYQRTRAFSEVHLLTCVLILNVAGGYLLWVYWRAAVNDSGSVPPDWSPDEVLKAANVTIEPQMRRFCQKCNRFKPPRSHHCSKCGICVRRMDHHCQWIGNCVGHNNYGDFFRFVVAVPFIISMQFAIITLTVVDHWNVDFYYTRPSTTEMVFIVLNYLMSLPVFLLVLFIALQHTWYMAGNMTTIESWEIDRMSTMVRRGVIPYMRYPFDIGFWGNVTAVLGPNPFTWMLPKPLPGDGLRYPTCVPDPAQYLWPPKDPRTKVPVLHDARRNAYPGVRQRTWNSVDPLSDHDSYESDENGGIAEIPIYRGHVRRGSEGYEVRPPRYDRDYWESVEGYEMPQWSSVQEPEEYPYGSFVGYGQYAEDDEE